MRGGRHLQQRGAGPPGAARGVPGGPLRGERRQRPLGAVWDGAGECGTHGLAGGTRRKGIGVDFRQLGLGVLILDV